MKGENQMSDISREEAFELLKKYNMIGDDADINSMIIYNLIKKSLDGDINAIRELKDITGNSSAQKLDVNLPMQINVEDDYGD